MNIQTLPRTGFEKWQDGINKAANDTKWHVWDCEIQMTVNEYNRHLSETAGYRPLDWQIIKAMAWVESGAANLEWNSRPMRIGVHGDPGLTSLLFGNEGGDLILPPAWKQQLTVGSVRSIPVHNIRAGVGYLLMKVASYEYRNISDADSKIYEITVKTGDSLNKIAKVNSSTIDTLQKLNPMVNVLQPGQRLKYQKASIKRVITNWQPISTSLIARRYNGGRDPNYAKKLDYVLGILRKGKVVVCVQ